MIMNKCLFDEIHCLDKKALLFQKTFDSLAFSEIHCGKSHRRVFLNIIV